MQALERQVYYAWLPATTEAHPHRGFVEFEPQDEGFVLGKQNTLGR
jgi:hypothetical protein